MGRLERRDYGHDLALVRVALPPEHEVAAVGQGPSVGQPVETMGHPLGLVWSYSRGNVAAVRRITFGDGGPVWFVQSTASISPGNSGGGLFDASGAIVGIAHGYFPRGENVNIYVHPIHVRAFLEGKEAAE